MTIEFNCECEDTNPAKTLEEYVEDMLVDLGFATIVASPPAGMALYCQKQLQRAQQQMYLQYPALRTKRFFRWTMQPGVRFYGMLDNDENWTDEEVTVSIASPGVVTFAGSAPANGRLISFTVEEDGTLPTGITAYTRYYVVNASGATCQFSLTLAGAAVDTSGSTTGQITASYSPATTCIFDMNPYAEIEGVWIVQPTNVWLPMAAGIPPVWYTTVAQEGIPARYEIRQCLEVLPAPDGPGYQLYVKGHFGLRAFTGDTDKPTIDGHLVYMWALANAKAHYGHPDASNIAAQARAHLGNLVAGTHLTKRYIPGAAMLPPAVMPSFLPLNGAPP